MKKDIVSIVIPIYNVELYMKKCIETIINQTYKEIEIILVDDGSTDGSGEIADGYKEMDSRIKVIHKINGGLSDARNAGIEQAKGKYICFIDSDDFIEKDMVEKMLNKINSLKADVIVCGYYIDWENNNGELIKQEKRQFEGDGYIDKNKVNQEVLEMLGYAWNKLYRLDYLKDNKFRFIKGLSLIEDTEFNSRVLAEAKIGIDRGLFNHYIQRNRVTLGNKNYDNLLELAIKLCKCHQYLFKKWNLKEEKIEEIKIRDYLLVLKRYSKICASQNKSDFKKMISELSENEEIKNMIMSKKYKNLKDKIFCFIIKHKLFFILKNYYKNR